MNINADKRSEPNVDPITDEDSNSARSKESIFLAFLFLLFFIDRYQFKRQFLSEWTKIDFMTELFASLLKIPNSRCIETWHKIKLMPSFRCFLRHCFPADRIANWHLHGLYTDTGTPGSCCLLSHTEEETFCILVSHLDIFLIYSTFSSRIRTSLPAAVITHLFILRLKVERSVSPTLNRFLPRRDIKFQNKRLPTSGPCIQMVETICLHSSTFFFIANQSKD